MRLLVVEDSEKLASLMKKLLSDNGFAVDCVETAEEAISAFELAEYDIIVLDLSLLDRDGTEFLKWLRKARHSTPVLVATARADVTQRVQLALVESFAGSAVRLERPESYSLPVEPRC